MSNVFTVAKYILQQKGAMSSMKLQKLCYYAQAWSLVWDDAPLFDEDFQAWRNGPVCYELYNLHRGQFSVHASDIPECHLAGPLTEEQKDTIEKVLEYYGDKDAQWLSRLTHMEDPWKQARQGVPDGAVCQNIVTKESMSEYYGSL